jgi:hypothetical protein
VAAGAAFAPPTRPVRFRGRVQGLGPADDDPCPCGSNRPACKCHWDRRTQRWQLPTYRPLRSGKRTGTSHDGCYANASEDCYGTLSSEHWLSKSILTAASDGKFVRVGELPFQQSGQIDERTPKSLGAKILCAGHNNALSDLDKAAHAMVQTLDGYYADQAGAADDFENEFDLFSGEEIERWLLKMVWGASEAFPNTPKIRGEIRRRHLSEFLFRDGDLPHGWGLYVSGSRSGRRVDPEHAMTVRLEGSAGELRSGSYEVGACDLPLRSGPEFRVSRLPQSSDRRQYF